VYSAPKTPTAFWICLESLVRLVCHGRGAYGLKGPLLVRQDLFGQLKQLILRRDKILHFEGAVLRLGAHLQDCCDCCASGGGGCGAKALIAGVEKSHGAVLHIDKNAPRETEVKQWPGPDARVRDVGLVLL